MVTAKVMQHTSLTESFLSYFLNSPGTKTLIHSTGTVSAFTRCIPYESGLDVLFLVLDSGTLAGLQRNRMEADRPDTASIIASVMTRNLEKTSSSCCLVRAGFVVNPFHLFLAVTIPLDFSVFRTESTWTPVGRFGSSWANLANSTTGTCSVSSCIASVR